ncbi:MAG TPA: low molecular weight protein-tyrosine-phosphatase [Rhodothermales bacterium]|nr:low molecular weight protein-tyrosine-phosphatase [Rhodothermales bacterium]
MIRVLFVCLGNICRSPLAEGVFRKLVADRGLSDRIEVDSAGTGGWHAGEPPDRRMRATAESRGVSLDGIRARQVKAVALDEFDYVFAMDRENLRDLKAMAARANDQALPGRLDDDSNLLWARDNSPLLFRTFDPVKDDPDVPDPYYGGSDGFTRVFEIVDRTSRAILDHICREEGLSPRDAASNQEGGGRAPA